MSKNIKFGKSFKFQKQLFSINFREENVLAVLVVA
jgi:hypothetical protein